MTKKKTHLYEGMFIISATLSDEARNRALERVKSEITNHGGEIQKEHAMGRRKLAYPIAGHKEGYYFLLYFNAPTDAIDPIWHEYHLNEDLIRFMTMRAEEVQEEIVFKELEIAQ